MDEVLGTCTDCGGDLTDGDYSQGECIACGHQITEADFA